MAKKRRTRKEKQLADKRLTNTARQEMPVQIPASPAATSPIYTFTHPTTHFQAQPATISTGSYTFLRKDLLRTAIVTCIIIAAQLVLFIYMNSH